METAKENSFVLFSSVCMVTFSRSYLKEFNLKKYGKDVLIFKNDPRILLFIILGLILAQNDWVFLKDGSRRRRIKFACWCIVLLALFLYSRVSSKS